MVLPVHQFHRVEVVVALLAEVMDSGYMRVLDLGRGPRFTEKPAASLVAAQEVGGNDFEGHMPIEYPLLLAQAGRASHPDA